MNEVDQAVEALVQAVLTSDVYQEYQACLAKVKELPDLKAQIDEMEQFQREYQSFRDDPLVSDFLAAELAFCRMVQDIESRITSQIDFE